MKISEGTLPEAVTVMVRLSPLETSVFPDLHIKINSEVQQIPVQNYKACELMPEVPVQTAGITACY
jgi:hypothetical protein